METEPDCTCVSSLSLYLLLSRNLYKATIQPLIKMEEQSGVAREEMKACDRQDEIF